MILECDVGNSFLKWRVISDAFEVIERGSVDYRSGLQALAPKSSFEKARLVSVASSEINNDLIAFIESKFGVGARLAASESSCAGVTNGYQHPETLGVDRWSAVVAAFKRCAGAVLVIDCGSAMTVDFVDAGGRHLGGYIIPGANLMMGALQRDTDGVRFERIDSCDVGFGVNTSAAVNSGVQAALEGGIAVAVNQAKMQSSEPFAILLTGGGGQVLMAAIDDQPAEYVPELVLDGLRWLLP